MASAEPEKVLNLVKSTPVTNHDDTSDLMRHTKKPCRSCVDFKTWIKQTSKGQTVSSKEVRNMFGNGYIGKALLMPSTRDVNFLFECANFLASYFLYSQTPSAPVLAYSVINILQLQ